jgi:tetratricopeptide (TPR) repeat protein
VLDLEPNSLLAFRTLARVYQAQRLYEDAVAAYQTSGKEGYWRWMLDYWNERAKQESVPRTSFANIYAPLGEKDEAFERLEKAFEEEEAMSGRGLKVDSIWDPLRDDPRFQDLLRRMNLEP